MTPSQLETAKALVRCPHWVWLDGCGDAEGRRRFPGRDILVGVYPESRFFLETNIKGLDRAIPNVTDDDPATVGCIEHLARQAWGETRVSVQPYSNIWITDVPEGKHGTYPSRAEAWAALLLAAPITTTPPNDSPGKPK